MRALEPTRTGTVERDGVRVHWEEFGAGEPAIALLPTWSIAHSRLWKFQIPHLARHYRVITFDGRGCGRSDRPTDPAAYSFLEFAADTRAVLDATDTERVVLVGLSMGAVWGIQVAVDEPARVAGVVCLGPAIAMVPMAPERVEYAFDERLDTTEGWAKYNRYHWLEGGYPDFLDFFFDRFFPEPHSTKQIEDFIGWGLEIPPETLVATDEGFVPPGHPRFRTVCERVSVPVLVIHGDEDEMSLHGNGRALAELVGGQLLTIAGGGHGVLARDPVIVNRAIKHFVDRVVR